MIARASAIFLLCFLLSGCASTRLSSIDGEVCVDGDQSVQMATNLWLQQEGAWRLRQSVLIEIGWKKFALDGLLQIDLKAETGRLVALNEMGILMFDLSLTKTEASFTRAVEQLLERPELADQIAVSIRRLFFHRDSLSEFDQNLPADRSTVSTDKATEYWFNCAGQPIRIYSKTDNWEATYAEYSLLDGYAVPQKVELEDTPKRLRLELWTREIKRINDAD